MGHLFGWDLPPGVSVRDLPGYDETPCAVCGNWADDCICPECPTCGQQGDPNCYVEEIPCVPKSKENHGLHLSQEQVASLSAAYEEYARAACYEHEALSRESYCEGED